MEGKSVPVSADADTGVDAGGGELVLVTGGNGYVGTHVISGLLRSGHRVRTTVRSHGRAASAAASVRSAVAASGVDPGGRLDIVAADLTADDGWDDAVAGCTHILHVASPFPSVQPENENEMIVPARDGTLRVLRAARDHGVRRVVMTSSFAAVGYMSPTSICGPWPIPARRDSASSPAANGPSAFCGSPGYWPSTWESAPPGYPRMR